MRHRYLHDGLKIISDISLGLSPASFQTADLSIRLRPEDEASLDNIVIPGHTLKLSAPGIGKWWVGQESELMLALSKQVQLDFAVEITLRIIFRELPMRHGTNVLHACAVAKGEHALLLLGNSGAGKSTAAYFLHTKGYKLISDDCCPIHEEPGVFSLCETSNFCRLADDSLEFFGQPSINRICGGKCLIKLTEHISDRRYRLDRILIIQAAKAPGTAALSPQIALRHILPSLWSSLRGKSPTAKQFEQLGRLVSSVPGILIERGTGWDGRFFSLLLEQVENSPDRKSGHCNILNANLALS